MTKPTWHRRLVSYALQCYRSRDHINRMCAVVSDLLLSPLQAVPPCREAPLPPQISELRAGTLAGRRSKTLATASVTIPAPKCMMQGRRANMSAAREGRAARHPAPFHPSCNPATPQPPFLLCSCCVHLYADRHARMLTSGQLRLRRPDVQTWAVSEAVAGWLH